MSALQERSIEQLADLILYVRWQNLIEVWEVIRKKMDSDDPDALRNGFQSARQRFLEGPLENHLEVRWGMSLCMHCNDDNIEKNGISYVQPSGDGLEFNQCLNCRVGILYDLVSANAKMDTYTIGLGKPEQFNGMSFFWNAIVPDSLGKFQPSYEVISKGQWMGTLSFDTSFTPRFLAFEKMTASTARDAEEPWTFDLPVEVKAAADAFIEAARLQIEVALELR
ncbi:MAG: hypothetical protein ACFFD9_09040 [Candidatus Thorarchaeota archaeon]